jgi:hypothetical protein
MSYKIKSIHITIHIAFCFRARPQIYRSNYEHHIRKFVCNKITTNNALHNFGASNSIAEKNTHIYSENVVPVVPVVPNLTTT